MNRHLRGLWLGLLGIGLSAGLAFGQASQIPPSVRSSTSLTSAQQQSIADAIAVDMQALQSDNPADQQKARDSLSDAVRDQGQLVASAVFKRIYATALNDAMTSLPAKADIRTRLNAAIITARVAQLAQNAQLSRATQKFLGDQTMPVALWGMKASRWILPYEAATPLFDANNDLLKAISAAAEKFPVGPVMEEAYEALSLQLANPDVTVKPAQGAIQIVVPVVQGLIDDRAQMAAKGEIDQPLAETRGSNFLANPEVWRAQAPASRVRSVQVMIDLLSVSADNCANPAAKSACVLVMQDLGRALYVVGLNENNKSVQAEATTVSKLRNDVSPAAARESADALISALRAHASFKDLTAPQKAEAK